MDPWPDLLSQSPLRSIGPCTIEPLRGDASNRRYYRVANNNATQILTIAPEREAYQSFIDLQAFFASHDIAVPQVVAEDPTNNAYLQTDLGDTRLFDYMKQNGHFNDIYKRVIDFLVTFQKHTLPGETSTLPAYHRRFDLEKLTSEIDVTLRALQACIDITTISPDVKKIFRLICSEIEALTPVLCHRDFHSKNIMLHKSRFVLIDFQDARLGPAVYDLVSLLRDSYIDMPEKSHDMLVHYYWQQIQNEPMLCQRVPECQDTFRYHYELVAFQRQFKAIGTFISQFAFHHNKRYLPFVQPTLTALIKLSEKRYPKLRQCLEEIRAALQTTLNGL